MSGKTSMFELLKERLTEEEIIKITCDYDLKFCRLEEENERLNNIIKEAREYIEKHIAIFKGGDMIVDMNVDEFLEMLGGNKE